MKNDFIGRFWNDKTEIVEVGEKRHVVKFEDRDKPCIVTGCNVCGGFFTREVGGVVYCAECGEPQ